MQYISPSSIVKLTSSLRRTLHSLSDHRHPGQPRLSWTTEIVIIEDFAAALPVSPLA